MLGFFLYNAFLGHLWLSFMIWLEIGLNMGCSISLVSVAISSRRVVLVQAIMVRSHIGVSVLYLKSINKNKIY